jgi:hypothetical protein
MVISIRLRLHTSTTNSISLDRQHRDRGLIKQLILPHQENDRVVVGRMTAANFLGG